MNIARLQKLADVIRELAHTSTSAEDGFCMAAYHHNCGTPSCIGGWADYLWPRQPFEWTGERAASALGMDATWLAVNLFEPALPISYADVTPAMAAAALDRIIAAGERYEDLTLEDVWGKL